MMTVVTKEDVRKKFRRNLVIVAAYESGISDRLLSDVFDIPIAEVQAIISLLTYVVEDDGEDQD